MSSDRRQHERFEMFARVQLDHGGQLESLTVLNISAGGVLLRNDQDIDFAVGDSIRLHFDVPELTTAFAIDATVVRVVTPTNKASALAAMWTSSDETAIASLAQILWGLKEV